MKNCTLLLLHFFAAFGYSQTKLISHKSHSGSDTTFATAVENNLFDSEESNFGIAPNRYEKNAVLDSVIYISKDKIILVTSEFCTQVDRDDYKILSSEKWKAGRETVGAYSIYSKNHSLDSIKNVLKTEYNFRNDIEKTVFIGYDNKPKKVTKNKKKSFVPLINSDFNFPSKSILIGFLSIITIVFSIISKSKSKSITT